MSWESLLKPGRLQAGLVSSRAVDTLPMLMSWSSVGLRFGYSTESLEYLCKITVWHYQRQQNKLFPLTVLFFKDKIWAGKSLHLEVLLSALKEIGLDSAVP